MQILSFEDGDVFKATVVVHNGATEGSNYLNMRCVDTEVSLETGCMRVVFLNKFVQDLLVCCSLSLSLRFCGSF
jgi:vacuolar protein sorting-associated protein 13A/C